MMGPDLCIWDLSVLLFWLLNHTQVHSKSLTEEPEESPLCEAGHYCPEGNVMPLPCPRGTYGPLNGGTSIKSCIPCPPDYFSSRAGVTACLPCGAHTQQLLPGQEICVCLGEGLSFQPSNGQCVCTLGFRPTADGSACVPVVYDICKDGKTRDQQGHCLSREEWVQHCSHKVCLSPEDFEGYDTALGLCVCRSAGENEACGGWCRGPGEVPPSLQLVCVGKMQLLSGRIGRQESAPSAVLHSLLQPWISCGMLDCSARMPFSRSVYLLQTGEQGFRAVMTFIPADVQVLFQEDTNVDRYGELTERMWAGGDTPSGEDINTEDVGLLNPTACVQQGDALLFTVTREHYPQYDVDNLYNTNPHFDWGPFRLLADGMSSSQLLRRHFLVLFPEPGVYVLKLSSAPHRRMYVKVLPPGGQCYLPGPFFPSIPRHLVAVGVRRRRHLLLHPDWPLVIGLLLGGTALLGVCVALLVLFRECGWPAKQPVNAQYRSLQQRHTLDDYASKGSRITVLKKNRRSVKAPGTEVTSQTELTADEFWDYEQQIDLESFSTTMFYEVLLKHSVTVTTRLGQLRGEVKELYQALQSRLTALSCSSWVVGVAGGKDYQALRRDVELERMRRKALGANLALLLNNQLQILNVEIQTQQETRAGLRARLMEATRLLEHECTDEGKLLEAPPHQYFSHLLLLN